MRARHYTYVSGPRALLIDVGSLNGLLRSLETKTDVLEITLSLVILGLQGALGTSEDILLLLESFLGLFGVFRHVC